MSETYTLHGELPVFDRPVLVVHFDGWIDASGAAGGAMSAITSSMELTTLATFDGDTYIDYRARRPTMELREGVNTRVVWPTIELRHGRTEGGIDLLTLTGPEPDMRWHAFAAEVAGLALRLGTFQMIALGAYPFAAPHTRPPRLSATSPSRDLVAALPYVRTSLDAPAGMSAVLEHALTEAGIASIGLWVQVPHYVAAMPYPRSTLALLGALHDATGISIDTAALAAEADEHALRIDRLVAANDDHMAMVRQLEAAYDALVDLTGNGPRALPSGPLPTGDDLAAEFERFLREQGH